MELLVQKKSIPIHSKLGDKAERSPSEWFWRFEPENIFNIKKKDALHNRVSCNKKTTCIVRRSNIGFLNPASRRCF